MNLYNEEEKELEQALLGEPNMGEGPPPPSSTPMFQDFPQEQQKVLGPMTADVPETPSTRDVVTNYIKSISPYSEEKRAELAKRAREGGSTLGAALAGFGAGIRGGDVGSTFMHTFDASKKRSEDELADFDRKRDNDPKSPESQLAQQLAAKMGMLNVEGLTAAQFKSYSPALAKMLELEEKKAQHRETNDLLKERAQDRKEARENSSEDRKLRQKEIDLRKDEAQKYREEKDTLARKDKEEKEIQGTPAQNLARGFAKRMEQAEEAFKSLRDSGYKREDASAAAAAQLPIYLRSGSSQAQDQAERNFINAVLRRESGAAISPSEFENAEIQYFPRSGNDETTLKQKAENRKTVFEALRREAGKTWGFDPNAIPSEAKGSGTPAINHSPEDLKAIDALNKQFPNNASPVVKIVKPGEQPRFIKESDLPAAEKANWKRAQ